MNRTGEVWVSPSHWLMDHDAVLDAYFVDGADQMLSGFDHIVDSYGPIVKNRVWSATHNVIFAIFGMLE